MLGYGRRWPDRVWAIEGCAGIGKHIANRLQYVLFNEAARLVLEGVASVQDIDAAVAHGPGMRWAFFGPFMTMHLAGGTGGHSRRARAIAWR